MQIEDEEINVDDVVEVIFKELTSDSGIIAFIMKRVK